MSAFPSDSHSSHLPASIDDADSLAAFFKVSRACVRKWTREGLPCIRLGRRAVRFDRQAALAWLQERSNGKGGSK